MSSDDGGDQENNEDRSHYHSSRSDQQAVDAAAARDPTVHQNPSTALVAAPQQQYIFFQNNGSQSGNSVANQNASSLSDSEQRAIPQQTLRFPSALHREEMFRSLAPVSVPSSMPFVSAIPPNSQLRLAVVHSLQPQQQLAYPHWGSATLGLPPITDASALPSRFSPVAINFPPLVTAVLPSQPALPTVAAARSSSFETHQGQASSSSAAVAAAFQQGSSLHGVQQQQAYRGMLASLRLHNNLTWQQQQYSLQHHQLGHPWSATHDSRCSTSPVAVGQLNPYVALQQQQQQQSNPTGAATTPPQLERYKLKHRRDGIDDDRKPAAKPNNEAADHDLRSDTSSSRQRYGGPLPRDNISNVSILVKPKRSRSAYNYFFQKQRALLVEEAQQRIENETGPKADGKKRRKRRRDYAKKPGISFEAMGKEIGRRWKEIHPDELSQYASMANADRERYEAERRVYDKRKAVNDSIRRQQLEYSVSDEAKERYLSDREDRMLSKKTKKGKKKEDQK